MATRPRSVPITAERDAVFLILRLTIGAMFLWVFVENLRKGAYTPAGYAGVIDYYVQHGHAPEAWKSVMRTMAAHAAVAGPIQGAAELAFGVLLTLGLLTRPVAAAAGLFLFTLWLSEWQAAWVWELLVPTVVAFCLAVSRAGRCWGLDQRLAASRPDAWWW